MKYRGDRQRALRKALGITQQELADRIGRSRSVIIKWEAGASPNAASAGLLADALNTSIDYLMGLPETKDERTEERREEDQTEFDNVLMVPIISPQVRVCAGIGNEYPAIEWDVQGRYPVRSGALAALYSGDSLLCMYVEGDSMEPQIHDGDIVLFNHAVDWVSGNIYVVCLDDRMMVKGLVSEGRGKPPILRSVNRSYRDIRITPESQFCIYGRVLRIITDRAPKPVL